MIYSVMQRVRKLSKSLNPKGVHNKAVIETYEHVYKICLSEIGKKAKIYELHYKGIFYFTYAQSLSHAIDLLEEHLNEELVSVLSFGVIPVNAYESNSLSREGENGIETLTFMDYVNDVGDLDVFCQSEEI